MCVLYCSFNLGTTVVLQYNRKIYTVLIDLDYTLMLALSASSRPHCHLSHFSLTILLNIKALLVLNFPKLKERKTKMMVFGPVLTDMGPCKKHLCPKVSRHEKNHDKEYYTGISSALYSFSILMHFSTKLNSVLNYPHENQIYRYK